MIKKNNIPLGDHPYVIAVVVISGLIAIIGGCIAVFVFTTGRENVPDIVRQGPTEQEEQLEKIGAVKPERSSPEDAAEAVFNIWIRKQGIPHRNMQFEIISNDGAFALVRIVGEFRERANSPWLEVQGETECKNVSDEWQCNQLLSFDLTPSQYATVQAWINATSTADTNNYMATATARAEATSASATIEAEQANISATAEAEKIVRGKKLVTIENVSDPKVDENRTLYWNITIRNDDDLPHKVLIFFQWECNICSDPIQGKGEEFLVPPNSVEKFNFDATLRNMVDAENLMHYKHLRQEIIAIDDSTIRTNEEIWSLIEIETIGGIIQEDRYGCTINIINNDYIPHLFKGQVRVVYEFKQREELQRVEEDFEFFLIGGKTGVKPGATEVFGFGIYTGGSPITKVEILSPASFTMEEIDWFNGYSDAYIPEEGKDIQISVSECAVTL